MMTIAEATITRFLKDWNGSSLKSSSKAIIALPECR